MLSVDKPQDFVEDDVNRRIRIKSVPEPVLASLRWPGRPEFSAGNLSWTYMIEHPRHHFAVFVGEAENGGAHAFEVWVNGSEQPRGLGAVAKTLSMDMRAHDPGWLRLKLDTLAALCTALECTPNDLLDIDTTPVTATPTPPATRAAASARPGRSMPPL